MNRKKFIVASALILPAFAIGQKIKSPPKLPKKGFVVRAGKSRFDEKTKLFGSNLVDIKVSTKDTDGALSISEYTGYTKGGPPLHIHPDADEIFIVLEGEHLFQLGDEQFRLTAIPFLFLVIPHMPRRSCRKKGNTFSFLRHRLKWRISSGH